MPAVSGAAMAAAMSDSTRPSGVNECEYSRTSPTADNKRHLAYLALDPRKSVPAKGEQPKLTGRHADCDARVMVERPLDDLTIALPQKAQREP